jgi:hypothetical protein
MKEFYVIATCKQLAYPSVVHSDRPKHAYLNPEKLVKLLKKNPSSVVSQNEEEKRQRKELRVI